MKTRKTPKECKEEFLAFKEEMQALLVKHNVYLYAEDEYGAELIDILAFKRETFDGSIQDEIFLDKLKD